MTLKYFPGKQEIYEARYNVQDYPIVDGTLTKTELLPGGATRGHAHRWAEVYFVAVGEGVLETKEPGSERPQVHELKPGSVIEVPPQHFHRVLTVTGITFWGVFLGEREEAKK